MSFYASVSPEYLEELRLQFEEDPKQVPFSWRIFFEGVSVGESYTHNGEMGVPHVANASSMAVDSSSAKASNQITEQQILELKVMDFIEVYRQKGHWRAQINPFGNKPVFEDFKIKKEDFGLQNVPSTMKFQMAKVLGLEPSNIDTIQNRLEAIYCGGMGSEFMHIEDDEMREWLAKKIETEVFIFSPEEQKRSLEMLTRAENFETFLQRTYTGQKRFSLEGGESVIPGLEAFTRIAIQNGAREIVIGMAHRGRLNVLTNILKKPYAKVFSEFEGLYKDKDPEDNGGDVKYHMGYSNDVLIDGKNLHISLAFNPSHLEAVNPVVEGMCRAKQIKLYGGDKLSIVPLLIHGDAAVIGQGVVAETLNFSRVHGYSTGGTIHVVINNQVGFTTNPEEARSTTYCTDFAKGIGAPVFHVNGNQPELVVKALKIATEFRTKFHRDAFVDIICYRKYGHNEGDEPRFTQPNMYKEISNIDSPLKSYTKLLIKHSVIDENYAVEVSNKVNAELEEALNQIRNGNLPDSQPAFLGHWKNLRHGSEEELFQTVNTGIPENAFTTIIEQLHSWPKDFKPNAKIEKMLTTRLQNIKSSNMLDWASGELLAYGSLLLEGTSVRLSGQDSKRGTFSHRHSTLVDSETQKTYVPLKGLETDGSNFTVLNSPLTELAVMGFDYGYSLADPQTLVLWEAQFGDFVNGAQIVIDQFLMSSEKKWNRMSGLVLLLPHGYEGQGPEHSSARLERFLQQSAEGNVQIIYPTLPSQLFHALRRQIHRNFRKPLIIMTPKSPLRMPEVVSKKEDFLNGSFQNMLITGAPPESAKQVIFCTGKVYWDLLKAVREKEVEKETAFVRLEQLYPLDPKRLVELKAQYNKATDWVWAQEEPQNMGAWTYILAQTYELDLPLRYVGRKPSASVAAGSPKAHALEHEKLIKSLFDLRAMPTKIAR